MDRRVKERLVGATILGLVVVLIVPELLSGPKPAVAVLQPAAAGAAMPVRSVTVDLVTNKATADDELSGPIPGATTAATSGAPGADATPAMRPGTAAGADGADRGAAVMSPESATPTPDGATPGGTTPGGTTPGGTTPGVPAPGAAGPRAQLPASPPVESGATSPRSGQGAARAEALHAGWAAQLGSFAAHGNAEKLERQLRNQGFSPYLSPTGSGRALRYRIRVGPFADRAAAERVAARLLKAGHPARVVAP